MGVIDREKEERKDGARDECNKYTTDSQELKDVVEDGGLEDAMQDAVHGQIDPQVCTV
jgi:hypothetical protein